MTTDSLNAAQGAAQGELVLDNNAPHVNADAICHGGRGPKRNTAARAATATASTASANGEPAGTIGANSASNACAHTVKCDRIASAHTPKRRNHPRTVDTGNSSVFAIFR